MTDTPTQPEPDCRPILLLDIDGTLNAVQEPANLVDDYVQVMVTERIWIVHHPVVLARLRRLHDAGRVEIRWLTSWPPPNIVKLTAALDLPAWQVAGTPYGRGRRDRTDAWKSEAAREICANEPDRPLIWVDDDLDYMRRIGELGWLDETRHPALIICPAWYHGLTDEHLDLIETFIAQQHQRRELPVTGTVPD